MSRRRTRPRLYRRGAAAVEFAFVAPIFVTILLGMTLTGRLLDTQGSLASAAREGARVGGADRSLRPATSASTNQMVSDEIRNYLSVRGLNADDVDIIIADVDDAGNAFDLDDPENSLKLFQVLVEMSYGDSGNVPIAGLEAVKLRGKAIFRNAEVLPN